MDALATISDAVADVQREVNDFSITLSDLSNRMAANESNVETLQNPPEAVPPGLLEWLSHHSIREVDTILDADLTGLSSNVTTLFSSVGDLNTGLSDEVSNRTVGDTGLQTQIDELSTAFSTNTDALNQEISDRALLASQTASQDAAINARIDLLESSLSEEVSIRTTATTSNSSQISTINASLQMVQTQIAQLQGIGVDPLGAQASQITSLTTIANDAAAATASESTARATADAALQASLNAISSSVSNLQTGLDSEATDRKAEDASFDVQIGTINTSISGLNTGLSAETSARTAADSGLQSQITDNTDDIATNASDLASEITDRTNADTDLQSQIDANTGSISANTGNITSLQALTDAMKVKFGIVKDGSGFVTSWRILDESAAAGSFNLRNLNNDVRLQNSGYVGKYMPAVPVVSFSSGDTYDTQYGTGATNQFHGTDGNDYTRSVNVYATGIAGTNGSVFLGTDFDTGGSLVRLGQVATTFNVCFSGYTNGQLSLWYRIKTTLADPTPRWFPVAMAKVSIPSPRTYEMAIGRAVVSINVPVGQVVEFGLTNLLILDASRSATDTTIYNGSVSIEAFNLTTIS